MALVPAHRDPFVEVVVTVADTCSSWLDSKLRVFLAGCALTLFVFGCSAPASEPPSSREGEVAEGLAVPVDPAPVSGQACLPEPVGNWQFDTCGASANLEDSTRNNFTATKNTSVACSAGHDTRGVSFNGLTSSVQVPDASAFHLTNAVTLAAWVRPTNIDGLHTIISKWYAPDSYMLLIENRQYKFSVALASGSTVSVTSPAALNSWSHVAGTFDGATINLYVNSVLVAQSAAVGTLQQSSQPINIGYWPSWNAFAGELDDVWLGDVPLTLGQVKTLALRSRPYVPRPTAYFKFDDCSTTAHPADSSGHGFIANEVGGVGCAPGYAGSDVSFDGTSAMLEIPDDPAFHFTNAVSVAAWVRPAAIDGLRTILNKWYAPDSYMLLIENSQFKFSVALAGGGTLSVTSPATANVWSHVAGVFDGATIKLYVNGALAASSAAAGTLQQSSAPLHIGSWPSWNAYLGEIDEAWLGGVALSARQVQVLARKTTSFGYSWPNALSSSNSDPWIATNHDEICELKPRVLALNFVNDPSKANFSNDVNQVIAGLTEGSRYHGYGDPNALPSLRPQVFKAIDLSDATPVPGWNHKNSSKFPLKCLGADYKFKYSQLFDPEFTAYYGVPDPATPGANLGLCDLVTRGQVQEVWLFIDGDADPVTCANGVSYADFQPLESVESKQIYTSNGSKVPGSFDNCAGNGCLDGQDEPAFQACGKSLKVVYVNSTRGPGCAIHSLGHSFESMARVGGSVPALGTEFAHFGNFDLNTRFPVAFSSWYGIMGDPTSAITFTGPDALSWTALSGASVGIMNPYGQGCGNVHFPPNARNHYDDQNPQSVLSTCEHYGLNDGPGGKDLQVLYNDAKSGLYDGLAHDCEGGWQVYWRQSFPGVNNPAWGSTANKMKNWWPYLYY